MLLHDIHTPHSYADNFHLPMSSIIAAYRENHSDPALWTVWRNLNACAAFLLLLAVGFQLGSWPQSFGAAILLLAAPRLPFSSPSLPSWHGNFIYFHSFYFLLLATAAGLCVWRDRSPSPGRSLVLGLSIGATFLYRSTLVFFPPLLALLDWASGRRRWKTLASLCVVPYLFLLPWTAMNWKVHHKFVPLEDGEASQNIVSGALGFVQKYDTEGSWTAYLPKTPEGAPVPLFPWAAGEVLRHPLRYVRGYALRLAFVFRLYPWLFPLAFLAAWKRRDREGFLPLGLLAAYLVGIHCFMAVLPEYFEPLGPLLAALAGGLIAPPRRPDPSARALSSAYLMTLLSLALGLSAFSLYRVCSYALSYGRGQAEELDSAIGRNPRDAWLLYERGFHYLEKGSIPQAVSDMDRALALRPDYEQRAGVLAWVRLLSGDSSPFIDWHAANDPEPFTDAGFLKAHGYLKLGMMEQFGRQLSALLPASAPGCGFGGDFILDQTHFWLKQRPLEERLRFIGECVRSAPNCGRLLFEQAELASQKGDPKTALAALKSALALDPNPDQKRRAAGLYMTLGRYQEALALLGFDEGFLKDWAAGIPEVQRKAVLGSMRRAEVKALDPAERGRFAAAYTALSKSPDAEPHPIGQTRAAVPAFRQERRIDPWLGLARVSAKTHDRQAGLSALHRAEALGPDRSQKAAIAGLYSSLGENQRALSILSDLLKKSSDPEAAAPRTKARLLSDRGVLEAMMGKSQEAIADLRAAIVLDPESMPPYVTLGGLYLSARKTEETLKLYGTALKKTPRREEEDLWNLIKRDRERLRKENP